jgi:hypothetical protein
MEFLRRLIDFTWRPDRRQQTGPLPSPCDPGDTQRGLLEQLHHFASGRRLATAEIRLCYLADVRSGSILLKKDFEGGL